MITISNQIELRHLRYFLQLAETLNFHRAAEQLYISQPGLSRQIKQMESLMGTKLFHRDRKTVRLTPAGIFLQQHATVVLNKLEQLYTQTRDIGDGKAGKVRIGFLGSAMQQVIPDLLLGLKEKHPGIHTSLDELSNSAQISRIQEGKLDLGFVRLASVPAGLELIPVFEDTFSLVMPKDHPLLKSGFTNMNQLKEEAFIFFREEYSPHYYRKVNSIFQDAGFSPLVSHQSIHALTIFKLVANNMGLALVPTSLQHGFNLDVTFVELRNLPQRAILYAVWKKEHHNNALTYCTEILRQKSTGLLKF